ncbi:AraC family transcriptional regulator [Puia dinghuensis]|uniref:AraC family transcriptional regulator n=1 Tax=Puia dinghuensis TaxID=1792502 RepID=A0A8J2XVL2_9BACT|nr:helix-turn-helix transcriptional regulator [Puia dinghuensis]GGB19556.1 AraC family transcriptional regulator [Puia dinghuensis]
MSKEKIPIYNIANLAAQPLDSGDFMIESLTSYVGRQPLHIHNAHRHTFYHLVCFTGGKGSHSIDFIQWPVEVGQLYFMVPGQVHSWNFDVRPEGYIIHFTEGFLRGFLLDPNYLDRFSFFSGHAADCVVRLASPLREKVVTLLAEMTDEFHGHSGGGVNPDLLRTQLVQLFLLVQSGVAAPRADSTAATTQKQQLLLALRKLMDQHYKTLRRPSEYAGLLYITPNHLNSLCRDLLGRSAGEVIRDRVLLEAKRLLTNAGMTVAEIGYELNFQDNSYFNRFFKKYEGVTPDEFRRKNVMK